MTQPALLIDQNCTVSVLNRNVPVNPDGTWVLSNVPANQGRVRARATCILSGITRFGQSNLFTVPVSGSVTLEPITFGPITPIPASLKLTPASPTLTSIGATTQITTIASYSSGTTADVTTFASGTNYTTSSPSVATISADGLVTAVSSGTTLITAFNEGTSGSVSIRIGIPPTITITSPASGATVTEGASIPVTVTTTGAAIVRYLLNSNVVFTTTTAPFRDDLYTIPLGVTSITLGAQADNGAGDTATAPNVVLNVAHDLLTTVSGNVVDSNGVAVSGAAVTVFGQFTSTTAANGSFSIPGVPTVRGNILAIASSTSAGLPVFGGSSSIAPVAGGVTNVGTIKLALGSTLSSCQPTSSLSVLIRGSDVSSYLPNGSWSETGTGIQLVPLEGVVSKATIPTAAAVNSCASNSATGQTVCTANNTTVYLITGSTVNTTLTSGATGFQSFTGGSCQNCGVAIDPSTNQAIVAIGLASGGPGGYQFLDLATNTLAAPIPAGTRTSEDISVDPGRHYVLSPNESNIFQIVQTQPSHKLFNLSVSTSGEFDSAGEDCTTGIALSTLEFTSNLFIADLTQAVFTPGAGTAPGTWAAPNQVQNLPEFSRLSAGTSGITIAPGSHLGIVTGEFGGAGFGAIQLPSTSGSGTPAVVDWVAANVPNDPSGAAWAMGLDPHTVTAYVSPSTGKAIGLMSNGARTYLALVDLQALLSAKRVTGSHNIDPTVNLVTSGVVTFVAVH